MILILCLSLYAFRSFAYEAPYLIDFQDELVSDRSTAIIWRGIPLRNRFEAIVSVTFKYDRGGYKCFFYVKSGAQSTGLLQQLQLKKTNHQFEEYSIQSSGQQRTWEIPITENPEALSDLETSRIIADLETVILDVCEETW